METNTDVPVIASPPIVQSGGIAVGSRRMTSLDVYRGFVMFLMMAEVLSLDQVAQAVPGKQFWAFVAFHQSHVPWVGCSLHDLIQPSFSFLVGVALPFSLSNRLSKGLSKTALIRHALIRSLILILLGIFLRSMSSNQTNFTFEDTLTQIGLGYPLLFLLGFCSKRIQIISLLIILIGYWLAFAVYPLPGPDFNYAEAKVAVDYEHNLGGFMGHWNKNTNLAAAFDRWFLNLFPREKPFTANGGGYTTLSFIPTLGTMIFGMFAGRILNEQVPANSKMKRFIITGLLMLLVALVLQWLGINPIVKRIWTPAWTIFSGGICFLLLTLFYFLTDVRQNHSWSFALKVIGMNSIAAYIIAHVLPDFIDQTFAIHIHKDYDKVFGMAYATLVSGILVLVVEWLILYWMYKRKLFLKV